MQTIKVIQQLDEFGKELKEHLFQIPLGAEITDFRVGEIQINFNFPIPSRLEMMAV